MAPWSPRRRRPEPEDGGAASGLAEALRAGGLVDEAWYRRTYPDAVGPAADAIEDYASRGATAGRDPNSHFSTRHYLDANPDVRAAGLNPLLHYQQAGWSEGRSAGPNFDTAYYTRSATLTR